MNQISPRVLPEFARNATMYQIFLRQFTAEGTINAAKEMIPHLAELGIGIAYLCPFFEEDDDPDRSHWSERQRLSGLDNPKNPYRMNDYFKIDPEYGTDDDFTSFVTEAHKYGIRIMLDLVYYHCGPRAKLLSLDPEYVQRNEKGGLVMGDWNFPLLNFNSKKLREYLWENMLYFVKKFDIDGYRCDVGERIPLEFWEEGRRRIERIKSDFLMLNEAVGTIEQEEKAFDFVYGFRARMIIDMMRELFTPGEIREIWKKYNPELRIMNHTDNHDIANDGYEERYERILPPAQNDLSLAFIFGLKGMPLLYNGQEIADSNRHSIYANHEYGNHLGINWRKAMTPRGQERMALVKKLIALRKKLDILEYGTCKYLETDRDDAVFAYLREWKDQKMLCVFNFRNEQLHVHIENLTFGKYEYILQGGAHVDGNSFAMPPYTYAWLGLS